MSRVDRMAPVESTSPVDRSASDARLRILHVDDEADFTDLVATFLERLDDRYEVVTAPTAEDGLAILDADGIDCIVSDYDMPGTNGIGFLEAVRERDRELPFILFTNKGSEEVAAEAIAAGVTDYLQKQTGTTQYVVLAKRIENAVEGYRTERALAESLERLALFFEASPLGTIEWDETGTVVRANPAAEDILGYDEDGLVGATWERLLPGGGREEASDAVEPLQAGTEGEHVITETVRQDGERLVCEWHHRVVADDAGDVVTAFSWFQDVTHRERREAALAAREERFRAIAETATDAIITIDAESTIRYANPSVASVFGYEPEELLGESLTMLMPEAEAERHRAAIDRYLETGERTLDWMNVELTGRHRGGHELDLRVSFSELVGDDRHFFTGIIRDLTEGSDDGT